MMSEYAGPNLFIVGQPKSGTSALFSFLRQHPDISASAVKEPQFFCKDLNSQYFHLSRVPRTIENYLMLFDNDGLPYHMEASTAYLYSEVAAQEIYNFNQQAKIIIMLREPVDFLYSYHRQLLRNSCKFETEANFMRALDLESERQQGKKIPKNVFDEKFLMYSKRVQYVDHLERFSRLFPASQIKIIIYDDFRENNLRSFGEVCKFLDIDDGFVPEIRTVNKQVQVRNRAFKQFMDKNLFPVKKFIKSTLDKNRFHKAREVYRSIIFSKKEIPVLSESEKVLLKRRYAHEVAALGKYLERDLVSDWGYAELLAEPKIESKQS
jgi:hypothetical protein